MFAIAKWQICFVNLEEKDKSFAYVPVTEASKLPDTTENSLICVVFILSDVALSMKQLPEVTILVLVIMAPPQWRLLLESSIETVHGCWKIMK